jgi:hypothetical protein
MSTVPQSQDMPRTDTAAGRKAWYLVGGVAALIQLAAILTYGVAQAMLGSRITTAAEFFAVQQSSRLESVLRSDFLLLFLIGAYLGTFPALYVALRRINPVATTFATLFTFIAVTGFFAIEPTFALLHLGDQYAAASSDAERALFLAAGEAVLAAGIWNSSGSYVGGMLLQGGGVLISLVMLGSKDFRNVTAITGLVGNAIDLTQHLIHPVAPGIAAPLMLLMGPFYLVWFPMLAWDLFRLSRRK